MSVSVQRIATKILVRILKATSKAPALREDFLFLGAFKLSRKPQILLKVLVEVSKRIHAPFEVRRVVSSEPGFWLVKVLLNSQLQRTDFQAPSFKKSLLEALMKTVSKVLKAEEEKTLLGVGISAKVLNAPKTVQHLVVKLLTELQKRFPRLSKKAHGAKLVVLFLTTSPLWSKTSPYLNNDSRRKILQEVKHAIADLELHGAKVARVVQRHRTRSRG
jgi:hypothetical protein